MICTISQLKDYNHCPQLAFFAHDLKRIPAKTPVALEVGSMFHGAMERRIDGQTPNMPQVPAWRDGSDEARHVWVKHKLWVPVERYEIDPRWTIMGIEQALVGEINGVDMQGRLDAIVTWQGKWWSLQWKTYTTDLLGLIEKVRLSWHEPAYQELARQHGMEPWGGTILGACQKLPGYRVVDKERIPVTDDERAAAFTTHYITRSPEVQATCITNLGHMLADMKERWNLQIRNHEACWGAHGRGHCPYYGVCHHGGSVDQPIYKDAEDRYKSV